MSKKKNEPLEIEFDISDEEYRRGIENQQLAIYRAAAKIQKGEQLNAIEKKFVAAVLLGAADGMSLNRPNDGPGNPRRKIPRDVVALFPVYKEKSGSGRKALEQLAHEFGCSEAALKKYLKNHKNEVEAYQSLYDLS